MTFKPIFSLVCLFMVSFSAYSNIQFLEIPPNKAFEMAATNKSCIFVYFYSKDLPACEIMNLKTFQDKGIKILIDNNFIPVRIEIQSEHFEQWESLFEVKCVPTCLVINKGGQLIEEIEGAYSAIGLQNKLKQALVKDKFIEDFRPIKNLINPDVEFIFDYNIVSKTLGGTLEDSLVKTDERLNNDFYTKYLYLASDETPTVEDAPEYRLESGTTKDIFKPKGKEIEKGSFEVQVGYFKGYQNAAILLESLKRKQDEPIRISKELKAGKYYYRVLIGGDLSKQSAIQVMRSLSQTGIECFIRLSSKK